MLFGNSDIVKTLLEAGANIDAQDNYLAKWYKAK